MRRSRMKTVKKFVLLVGSCILIALGFYFSPNISRWMGFNDDSDTFEVFINDGKTRHSNYANDSLAIRKELKNFLVKQENFFDSKEYSSGTDIIIDTIVYSPDAKRLAILIIAKNPLPKQVGQGKEGAFYYNATSYLGVRNKDSISVSWLGPNFRNSRDRHELSKAIRETFFRRLSPKESTGVYAYKYNLNDRRFWTSNLWKEKEGSTAAKQEIQDEAEQ